MAYSDSIDALKSALDGYSVQEEKLTALYKNAMENAEKGFEASLKALKTQYRNDRNEASKDTAREERNLMTMLANRGLGQSGEAVQAKLNSGIILGNRLSKINDGLRDDRLKLEQELADNKLKISSEHTDRMGDILKHKDGINLDIASLELKKEQGDADREAQAKLNADKLANEQAMLDKKLTSEREALDAKLKAEKERADAELYAKYYSASSGNTSSGGGFGGGSTDGDSDGYIPAATAKELAKQLVTSATGGNTINSEKDEYRINKYLLTLLDDYKIDSDYLTDLMFLLKGYGYEALEIAQMREKVITYEAKEYYFTNYDSYYDKYVLSGYSEDEARSMAKESALKLELDYLYKNCGYDLSLFRQYCNVLHLNKEAVTEYVRGIRFLSGESSSAGHKASARSVQ